MTPLYLRVDVCTYRGLRDGVPGALDVLKKAKARATFCVTFGPDQSGRALIKMLNPAFAWKMMRTNAVGTYGFATAFYGTLLPSPMVGAGLPDLLKRIKSEGHEIAMHGWNHRGWQDKLAKYGREKLSTEFTKMRDAYRSAVGEEPTSFAAPAWRVTGDLLSLQEEAKLAFASDVRGTAPFLPKFEGRDYPVPQLPVTLPTLDECLGRMSAQEFVDDIVKKSKAQEYSCFTAHAESEGRGFQGEFEAILRGIGRPIVPLGEAPRTDLPRCEMKMGPIEGRPYDVCVQA